MVRPDAALAYDSGFVIANARRLPEPPAGDGFCFACRPRKGLVTCADCGGSGVLSRGGYTRNNPVNLKSVVGSKWTAHERTFGWRHFIVLSRRKQGAMNFVELGSTCDESVRFWVNIANLKSRERWSCGWLERDEMRAVAEDGGGTAPGAGGRCRNCSGSGACRCAACTSPTGVLNV